MPLKRAWPVLGALSAAALLFAGWTVWRAQGVLGVARARVSAESEIAFTSRILAPVIPAGLESVGAPAVFTDARMFQGHLFIGGPAGLAEYDPSGALLTRYRVGIELPPAPLTALAAAGPDLWIATAGEGLVDFDGRSFRQIRPEDARYRKITALAASETGRILIGTEIAGVLAYDGRELRPFHSSLSAVHVTALAGDDTDLWIGTVDRGLLHWKAGAMETIVDPLPDPQVLSIAMDGDAVYAGTALGVAEIRGGKFARVVAQGYFAQSLFAAEGKLWIGTLDEGMVELGARRSPVCDGCSIKKIIRGDGEVLALAEDSLWHGSEQLIRRDSATLADRNISALALDGSGRLWVGYFDRGLQILGGPRYEDDRLFCVNRIAHSRGISAVATANGLVLFNASGTRRRVLTHDNGLIANQVTDIVLRPDGSMIAATPAGISFIDSTGIRSIYAFQGLVNNHVYTLAVDGDRTLAGTLGGLSILDGPMVKTSLMHQNWITALVRRGEDYFAGTYGSGVLKLDALNHWESFPELRGVEVNQNAMLSTPTAIYAGTLDRGLAVYNGRWNFWTAGLPSRNVTALEARDGILYIGTDNGLVRVPESTVSQ